MKNRLFVFILIVLSLTPYISWSQNTETTPPASTSGDKSSVTLVKIHSDTPTEVPTPTNVLTSTPYPTYSKETPTSTPPPTFSPTPYGDSKRFIRAYTTGTHKDTDDPEIVRDLVFAPFGKSFYSANANKKDIRWNTETGKIEKIFDLGKYCHSGFLYLTNDGKKLFQGVYYDKIVTFGWDTENGNLITNKVWEIPVTKYQLFNNGKKCILGSGNEGFYIWDIVKDKLVQYQPVKYGGPINQVSVSPLEDYYALIDRDPGDHFSNRDPFFNMDNRLILWNIEKQKASYTIDLYPKIVINIQWVSNGEFVWLISFKRYRDPSKPYSCHLDLYSVASKECLYQISFPALIDYVRFTKSGDKYFICQNNTIKIYRTFTGELLAELPHADSIASAIFSPDEKMVLTGSNNITGTAAARLWDISDLREYPIPTFIPSTPTPTETPSLTPTPTLIPTPTLTPTPFKPVSTDAKYEIHPVARNLVQDSSWAHGGKFAFDPKTGELILAIVQTKADYYRYLNIYKYPLPSEYTDIKPNSTPLISYRVEHEDIVDIFAGEEGTLYVNQWNVLHILRPDGNNQSIPVNGYTTRALHVVSNTSHIPDTKPGDLLLLRRVWKDGIDEGTQIDKLEIANISIGFTPLIDVNAMPAYLNFISLTEGPGGYLYILLTGTETNIYGHTAGRGPTKIIYWNENKQFKEWTHFSIDDNGRFFRYRNGYLLYSHQESVFYVTTFQNYGEYQTELLRISNTGTPVQLIAQSISPFSILESPSQKIYFESYGQDQSTTLSNLSVEEYNTPTPTPSEPTPTPTPIAGWFVLDGFGGIHSTNKDIPSPVLPYWIDFNIVRDIEPDPLGRGWYMLDGFGGIHTSSPDLPKPDTLPYFCFDIARRLKIKEENGKLEFFLLDGYGGIYSTNPNFNNSKVFWFGTDRARGLQLDNKENDWIVMDSYGTLYFSKNSTIDIIRLTHPCLISPIMRSFVRFPDEITVMLDLSGGRHTNQYFPANDVVKGLSPDFYFPGWDIVWDMEVIPENMAKRGN